MAANILPETNYLRECFSYNPKTGLLTWKPRPVHHFKDAGYAARSRTRCAGKQAGYKVGGGIDIHLDEMNYRVHRIIWKLVTGNEPPPLIDHKNGNPFDNRFENLRPATDQQNKCNSKRHKRKSPYPKGVYLHHTGKFYSRISAFGKDRHLGVFKTIKAASAAYRAAAEILHGEFAAHKHR